MRRALLVTLLLSASAVAACGGDGVETGGGGGAPDGGMHGLLGLLPNDDEAADFVVLNDLAAAADAGGVEVPPADADEADVNHYFVLLSVDEEAGLGTAPGQFYGQTANEVDAWHEEFGFSPVSITADATAGEPPAHYQAFVGDFDPDATQEAVESDPTWSDVLEEVDYGGTTYYSWNDDDEIDAERITPVRRIGESLRLFVSDEVGFAARSTPVMEAQLDAFTGEAPTMAENELLGPMAEALDDLGAFSAVLSDDPALFEGGGDPALEPYDAFATGAARVDDETRMLVVLSNPDEATAEENAGRLADVVAQGESVTTRQPWSDLLGEGEITTEGNLTVASFPVENIRLWLTLVFQRDSLLAVG